MIVDRRLCKISQNSFDGVAVIFYKYYWPRERERGRVSVPDGASFQTRAALDLFPFPHPSIVDRRFRVLRVSRSRCFCAFP